MTRTVAPPALLGVFLLAVLLALAGATRAQAQAACLAPEEAARHTGERGCVEGLVTAVVYARQSTGQPTFLDLGPQFTAVIWSEDRPKFEPPPESWRGRRARITGRIEIFRGKAQIVLRDPGQLSVAGAPLAVTATLTRTPAATAIPAPPSSTPAAIPTPMVATSAPLPSLSPSPTLTASPAPVANLVSTPPRETAIARATVAAQPGATAAPAPAAVSVEEGRPSRALLLAGVALLAAGGGGGAWLALRGRAGR